MSETDKLIALLQHQIKVQQEQHKEQMESMMKLLQTGSQGTQVTAANLATPSPAIPDFEPFDSTSELWPDYWDRFCTFAGAHSVSEDRKAQIFLTNQSKEVYRLLGNLARQQNPPKKINDLTMEEIVNFMKTQYDPKRFVVHERFKFWSEMRRKPGETLQELAARIRQDAATCDFASIKDPQDEALRSRFICSVNNEAVLKALFKVKDDELDFTRAIEIAIETENAARVAKDTVHGVKPKPVNKVTPHHKGNSKGKENESKDAKTKYSCYRCGGNHKSDDCRFKNANCHSCGTKGHIGKVCRKKNTNSKSIKTSVSRIDEVCAVSGKQSTSKLEVQLEVQGKPISMELDTATSGNFISKEVWQDLGCPTLVKSRTKYETASQHPLPVKGTFVAKTVAQDSEEPHDIQYTVSEIPGLNLLGRDATRELGISVDQVLNATERCNAVFSHLKADQKLQDECKALCQEFPDLWKPELGCLKNMVLEVKFKAKAQPIFRKARPVPFAMEAALEEAYNDGIAKGVWEPVQFCKYGTPVVPIKKALLPGQEKPKIRVCGDYSVTVNTQLEEHRHPLPLPEHLMRKLGGGYGFTKIDLADAYNQIKLAPESQRRLALSTHKGVLLQKRLPFGIKSATGYFQQVMDQLTKDLPGVATYLDDILISGKDAKDHLSNLRRLLKRLEESGLRCRLEKCQFAQPYVEYLGHLLSQEGIAKGPKVDGILHMPTPKDVSSLKAFLGSVQFYAKFLPSDLATISEPLYKLTKKNTKWKWEREQEESFQRLKELLSSENVLVHFDEKLPLGLACDASSVGIGAVLFHRFPDGSERPIVNASKTLTECQRNYSQIQKEALSIVFGLKKFYQYLHGRHFLLLTDHRPLLALFGPGKDVPLLAANRLARWALFLSQFDYKIEFRKTKDHSNADALSRLPHSADAKFDEEESEDDAEMVCTIETIDNKVAPTEGGSLAKESAKDPILANVLRYTREGWPPKKSDEGSEMRRYRELAGSLAICNGCLVHGSRVVIPTSMRRQVLEMLHLGHFGMQRMKQLARTAVYWPNIDDDIETTCRHCVPCGEHQNKPAKPAIHPWMLPEKPWSRIHLNHAINFMGTNWLLITDAYSKYPCIHPTQSVSAKATMDLLEQDFAHFGYPHTLVTDNASAFLSEEFQSWCRERGIVHLTGAPYHPATNGSAERLVQTFKQALRKSNLPPRKALQEFLMQFRRTPNSSGYSPSELLNSRQIRTKLDTLLPSPAHKAQGRQAKQAAKSQQEEKVSKVTRHYQVGDPVYALYFGPRRDQQGRWVPAVITKRKGSRTFNVRVQPKGPTWRRHLEQLQPRHTSEEDTEPGYCPLKQSLTDSSDGLTATLPETKTGEVARREATAPERGQTTASEGGQEDASPPYGPLNPRRSTRVRKPTRRFSPSS